MNLKLLRFLVVPLATAMSLMLPAAVLGQQPVQTGTQTATWEESKIRPFRVNVLEKSARRPPPPPRGDAVARSGDGR